MAADIISSTTQQFLDIHDITNNYVIMKDGTVSLVITVDAMNFGLLAEEEQDAVMYAYAGLLNSLNYTVQIVINSQTKDVTSYLQLLKDQETNVDNETLRKRIRAYREFVANLIHDRNVLDKKFYVVIPANAVELGIMGAKSVLPGQGDKFDITSIERSLLLERASNVLDPRRDHLIAQFARIGLYSRQLTTQEIIQLFYIRYNPEATEGQQIAESNSYTAPLVQASIQGNFMPDTNATQPQAAATSTPPTQPQATTSPEDTTTPAAGQAPVVTPEQSPIETMPNILSNQPGAPGETTPPTAAPAMDAASNMGSMPDPAAASPSPAASPSTTPAPVATPTPSATTPAMDSSSETTAKTPVESTTTAAPGTAGTMPAPETPAAAPGTTTQNTSATDMAEDESKVQADLNATVQQMGAAAATPDMSSPSATGTPAATPPAATETTTTSADTKKAGGDLPPLPEI